MKKSREEYFHDASKRGTNVLFYNFIISSIYFETCIVGRGHGKRAAGPHAARLKYPDFQCVSYFYSRCRIEPVRDVG